MNIYEALHFVKNEGKQAIHEDFATHLYVLYSQKNQRYMWSDGSAFSVDHLGDSAKKDNLWQVKNKEEQLGIFIRQAKEIIKRMEENLKNES